VIEVFKDPKYGDCYACGRKVELYKVSLSMEGESAAHSFFICRSCLKELARAIQEADDEGKIMEVLPKEMSHFVERWCNKDKYVREFKCRLYCRNRDGTYTALDNRTGDCWTEDFKTKDHAIAWLEDEFEVGDEL
jgi:hypothetical protein